MRRPYTIAQYAATVGEVRDRLPHAGITADVIVGFPGETDEDVDALVQYLQTSPLTQLHVFPYSDRPGTEAAAMPHKVHGTAVRCDGSHTLDEGHLDPVLPSAPALRHRGERARLRPFRRALAHVAIRGPARTPGHGNGVGGWPVAVRRVRAAV